MIYHIVLTLFLNTDMDDKIKEILQDAYLKVTEKPRLIIEVFSNYFGEDNVDFQNFISFDDFTNIVKAMYGGNLKPLSQYTEEEEKENFKNNLLNVQQIEEISDKIYEYKSYIEILVHFPKLIVTNEHDKSIEITHLFVKVKIDYNGTISGVFKLNRSEYTIAQYLSDYMHSHVPGINYSNMNKFLTPCLGTGPIRNTVTSLSREYDIDLWNLFCLELDKYVRTESIEGVPYRKLENVGSKGGLVQSEIHLTSDKMSNYELPKLVFQPFIIHLLESRILNYSFKNGKYSISMSSTECIITISNEFIRWYNDKFNKGLYVITYDAMCENNVLIPVYIINNMIFRKNTRNQSYCNAFKNINKHIEICKFKNNPVILNILKDKIEEDNSYNILNINIVSFIVTNILKVLNYEYGNIESANNTSKKTIYI